MKKYDVVVIGAGDVGFIHVMNFPLLDDFIMYIISHKAPQSVHLQSSEKSDMNIIVK